MSALTEQFLLLAPLVLLLTLLAGLILFVFYTTDRRFKLKFVLGPALMAIAIFSFMLVGSKLGYAWPHALPDDYEYLGHKVLHNTREKTWIDIMIIPKGEQAARLQRVPHTKELEKQLKEAQQLRGQSGGSVGMRRQGGQGKPNPEGKGSGKANSDSSLKPFTPYKILPQDTMPKEPIGPPPEGPPSKPKITA